MFRKMLPSLTPNFNGYPSNINEIFNARQIYISDIRITPEYIRYIRPLKKKRFINHIKNKILININILKKRPDQYNYKKFCKIALKEQLIDNIKDSDYKNPIISVILPSYNKQKILLKSIRSIQNQNFKNIEIIIVNDCSDDNSSEIFNYLLETDKRIRIFHHMKNLGVFRSRIDGILYSRGNYIIAFDTGDFYEDNYVLSDAYKIVKKYNLDSCKFLFRIIYNINNLTNFSIPFHIGKKSKIIYKPRNIKFFNDKIAKNWGNIWNRLVRADTYINGLYLLNELMLNAYKNFWDDIWHNNIINKVSNNYTIFERVGYVYFLDGKGEGTPKFKTREQNNSMVREYISFLYFDYNFCRKSSCKTSIIEKLRYYNEKSNNIRINNFISHFEVLNNLLKNLIKDPEINYNDKEYCNRLLNESITRERIINGIRKMKLR